MVKRFSNLTDAARKTLRANDAGMFIKPGPQQYPHQWNWDSAIVALGLSHFDLPRALTEIRSLLGGQWKDGMLPHVVYHHTPSDYFPDPSFWKIEKSQCAPGVPTSGITQPPLLTTIVRKIHQRKNILDFVREVYPALLAWQRWLFSARDADGSGLACIIHPWESGTDDSPRWLNVMENFTPSGSPDFQRGDTRHVSPTERPFQSDYERFIYLIDLFRRNAYQPSALLERSPFLVQDVLFNSILCRATEDLRALALELGEPADELDSRLNKMLEAINQRFYDEQTGLYLDFDLRRSDHIRVNTAATFMPLFAGAASPQQELRLVEDHLLNPAEYAPDGLLRYWITSTSRSETTWEPRRYWRGPVWINMNWFLAEGLLRYGYKDLAQELIDHSLKLMQLSGFREYYDPVQGAGCGSEDFSWSAALAIEMEQSINHSKD